MDFNIILKFLKDIARHNDRAWFEKHKATYLICKQEYEDFVTELLKELIKFDGSLTGLNPKKLPLRIYRDVRFSKDKRPYKTNMGAGFSPNGKMEQEPGYYLHIEPGNKSMIAGGLYMPDPTNLSRIRQEIDYNAASLKKIMNNRKFKSLFGGFDESNKLKTMPKGYAKDHQDIEFLKLKSFVVMHYFTDKEVLDKKFLKNLSAVAKNIKPLNDFLKEAIS